MKHANKAELERESALETAKVGYETVLRDANFEVMNCVVVGGTGQ